MVGRSGFSGSFMDRRSEIYEKAMALFAERGYDNTPMSLVSKSLGLSKAGIYHYFESKEQLLFLTHEYFMNKNLIPILEEAEKITDPIKRIAYFIKNNTRSLASDDSGRLLIREAPRLSPENYQVIKGIWRKVFELFRNTLDQLGREGKVKKINPTFASFAAIGMMGWVIYWFDNTQDGSIDNLSDDFIEIFLRGILEAPVQPPRHEGPREGQENSCTSHEE